MTVNVDYTKRALLDSTAIDRAWYNEDSQELFLELHGVIYRYDNVKDWEYNALTTTASAGSYYRNYIRGHHHGDRLGPVSDLVERNTKVVTANTARTRVGLGDLNFYPGQPEKKQVVQGLAIGVKPHLPLTKDAPTKESRGEYAHTMEFTVGNDTTEKTHVVFADSMDDAIEDFFELVAKLGQTVTLKGVHVRFE